MKSLIGALGRGALAGGLLAAGAQALSVAWVALTAGSDPASQRIAGATLALGSHRALFVLGLIGAVAAVGAAVGAVGSAVAGLSAGAGHRGSLPRELGRCALVLALLVLARALWEPALLTPALGFSGALAWLAPRLDPRVPLAGAALVLATPALVRLVFRLVLRLRKRALPVLFATPSLFLQAAAPVAPAPSHRAAEGPAPRIRNVLLIAADSVRPDHLSALGYGRPTTPNIDRLIREGTLFDRALAPLARTTPAWLSILTGRYPHSHGVRHMFPDARLRPRSLWSLSSEAGARGLATSLVTDYAGDFFGQFAFGFQRALLPPPLDLRTVFERALLERSPLALALLGPLPEIVRPRAFRHLMTAADPDRLATEAIRHLGDEPFFLLTFFSATHVPFAARWPHYLRFSSPAYGGPHRFAYDVGDLTAMARAETELGAADVAQVRGLYDGALVAVDQAVGRILEALRKRGLDRSTLVVFLSDHGENLFEPGQTTLHGKWFRGGDEANRVPLLFRGPGIAAGQRISRPVSLVDVAPTMAEVMGWEAPPRADGRSLLASLRGQPLPDRPVFAETGLWLTGRIDGEGLSYPALHELLDVDPLDGAIVVNPKYEDMVVRAKHRAIWDGTLKLVHEPTLAGARVRLFDLASDPRQSRDLGADGADGRRLRSTLLEWMARDPEREVDGREHLVRDRGS